MSGWEIFTWISTVILGFGSVIVFGFFLKQLPEMLKKTDQKPKK